jgi:glycosyltransferase involved in cell wall biosynthesis
MKKNKNLKEIKILVISNNVFSETNNNGKTISSFFKNFPSHNIAQLYFSEEVPVGMCFANFFRITDRDMLNSFTKKKFCPGEKVIASYNNSDKKVNKAFETLTEISKKTNTARIFREIVWKMGRWESRSLKKWLDQISPDLVFFCAGDSGFAFDITTYTVNRFNSKLAIYITDDYILKRKTINFMWWIRRVYILRKLKKILSYSDYFFTISNKMKIRYKEIFGKDSIVLMNLIDPMRDQFTVSLANPTLTFLYAGGFHHNRFKTLFLLSKAIKKYNANFGIKKKAYLKIYSNQKPNSSILSDIVIPGSSEFGGSLKNRELKKVLNSCDIPVHVESFDKSSIEATRLSISTKIPEYLSLGKPVLAIGPKELASMEYLENAAFCITNPNFLYTDLLRLISNQKIRTDLSNRSLNIFEKNHKNNIFLESLLNNTSDVTHNHPK